MKRFVVFAVASLALVSAYPMPDDPYNAPPSYNPPPPKSYKPAPRPYKPEEDLPPQPYQFEYGVSDQYTGANFKAAETQDEKGTVLGEYRVNLPDGRVQTVTYRADEYGGFVADVKYEGEPVYPPEPEEGYGNTYKKYAKGSRPSYNRPRPQYEPAPSYEEN